MNKEWYEFFIVVIFVGTFTVFNSIWVWTHMKEYSMGVLAICVCLLGFWYWSEWKEEGKRLKEC